MQFTRVLPYGCLGLMLPASLSPAAAAPYTFNCPAVLPAAAVQIVSPPPGWIPFTPSFLRLHAAGALGGPPQSMTILKGETYQRGKNKVVNVFELDGMPGEKWRQCGYGLGNEVTLSQRLPDSTRGCSVTYTTTRPHGWTVIDIHCH